MFQFLFALLRNPVFLLGTALIVTLGYYYNQLVKTYAQVEEALEKLETALQKRKALMGEWSQVARAVSPSLAEEIDQIRMPENLPMLKDNLALRFGEERDVSIEWEPLFRKFTQDAAITGHESFSLLRENTGKADISIAEARQAYNSAARSFNLQTETFPSGMIAGILGIQRQELFL